MHITVHTRPLLLILAFSALTCAYGQKYNFVNWTVEDGLVQSQASYLCQDNFRQLWIGTEGGMSCFDGKKFRSFTVQDGLPANHISSLLASDGKLYVGTNNGLAIFTGRSFRHLKLDTLESDHIRSIENGTNKDVYAISNFKLFRIIGQKSERILVSGDSLEKVTSVFKIARGQLIVSVYGNGVYAGSERTWIKAGEASTEQKRRVVLRSFVSSVGDTLLAYGNGLFVIRRKIIERYVLNGETPDVMAVICIEEDERKNLWLGTDKGACKIENGHFYYFNGRSGFTDNTVNHIFRDAENNLWFATNADGIYKYRENTFTYYDKSSGLSNPIVMGVVQTKDSLIYVAGLGGGLFVTNGQSVLSPAPKCEPLTDSRVNCLYAGNDNNLWIGTLNQGIYRYNKKTGLHRPATKDNALPPGATVFSEDPQGNLIAGSNHGLYVIRKNGEIKMIYMPGLLVTAIKKFDATRMIIGTSNGLYLLDSSGNASPFLEKQFKGASVMCAELKDRRLYVGTSDKGIYCYQLDEKKIENFNTADGLPSNFIYSIDAAEPHRLWAGTGFGISRIGLHENGKIRSIKNYGRSDGLLGMECNHNSLLRAADSSLWFGTTKGLFHFDPHASSPEKAQPLVLLRSVKLFSSEITDNELYKEAATWFDVPQGLELPHSQNHLSFELGSLYFTNPEDVLYRYMLQGIDKGYTTSNNPFLMYPSLPPGKYTLKVKGITKGGVESINEISYPFEIRKAFYQTGFFQVLVIVILLGTGALIAWLITRARHKRKQKDKELHEKIREEEFMKLRQRTAEDFHDEMGNSLTRISVLTDVLKIKLNGTEKDVSHLVQQIKDNTTSLYNGSRDIIWSLNSKNDALFEIAEHIKDIGSEIFQDTPVEFRYSHNIEQGNPLKLKLDYSRNLTMIFKEAYSNILKHANASKVEVFIELDENKSLKVNLVDNGSGFENTSSSKGNGLRNMQNRVERMQGELEVKSRKKSPPGGEAGGTEINILLQDIFVN